jgi:murein DD-endopeptidase MepM/ murein hydrolase activator NlpD
VKLRLGLVLVLALAVAFAWTGAAGAAGAGAGDTTTTTAPGDTTTTVPTTDTTLPPDSTTTTLPGDTTTTVPGETTTTVGPPEDPAQGSDGAAEPVATDPREIPSKGLYANQGSLAHALAVRGTLRVAQATALETKAAHDAAIAQVAAITASLADITRQVAELKGQQRQALQELNDARTQLRARAAGAYVRGNLTGAATVLAATDATDYLNRVVLMDAVLDTDQTAIERYKAAKARVTGSVATLADEMVQVEDDLSAARAREAAAAEEVESAQFDLDVFAKGGTIAIHGFVFPVDDPHDFVDSFGAPRLVGTPNQHWHEGVDIMAPRNTQLFACERGIITKVGTNELGGLSLWLKGESGTYYYYAHLDHFADGLTAGMLVESGQLVGFVGNTGDAAGGPTHLHFELHPDGGPAVDAYPLLKVVDSLDHKQPAQ